MPRPRAGDATVTRLPNLATMRIAVPLALVLAAGCSTPATDAHDDVFPTGPEPTDAASIAAGRKCALADIAKGDPHLLTFGLLSHDFSPLDMETGLPRQSLGDEVTPESESFRKGYNDAMREALVAGRTFTYKDRATTRDELEARFTRPDVVTLTPEHPSAGVPGGTLTIELVPLHYASDPPEKTTPYLYVGDTSTGRRVELQYLREPSARIAFDAGARTLLIRDDGFECFYTYDLATRRMLQHFVAPGTSQDELFRSEVVFPSRLPREPDRPADWRQRGAHPPMDVPPHVDPDRFTNLVLDIRLYWTSAVAARERGDRDRAEFLEDCARVAYQNAPWTPGPFDAALQGEGIDVAPLKLPAKKPGE